MKAYIDWDSNIVYDICVVITTYNREQMLKLLLEDIEKQRGVNKILVLIFNDGSKKKYELKKYANIDIGYIHYRNNYGKYRYWELINNTFAYCKNTNSKYFIYLPDDIRLKKGFFKKSISLQETINKGVLSLLLDKERIKRTNWTNILAIDMGDKYLTQWCDMCFICNKSFFETLEYKIISINMSRWGQNKLLSSGVGQQISMRLFDKLFPMYHVKETLVTHDDHESVMNKTERKKNKLLT